MPKLVKAKMRPMLPTLKERKRYLAYEIISNKKINDFRAISENINEAGTKFMGMSGFSKAGVIFIGKWNEEKQRGLIRVGHKHVNELKASLILIKELNHAPVIFRSVGVSGIIKKAEKKYLAS